MNFKLNIVIFMILVISVLSILANDGKYTPSKYNNAGKYIPDDEGQYKPQRKWRYVHVYDARHLGQYHHIHIPYDGGYGPYSHLNNPYNHIDNPYHPDFDPTGDYSFVDSVSKYGDPFKNDVYYINTPEYYEAYGLPFPSQSSSDSSSSASKKFPSILNPPANFKNPNYNQNIDQISFTTEYPQTFNTFDFDSQSQSKLIPSGNGVRQEETPPLDRRTYHDEGGWKIIRQEESKNKKKYDYLYETENGILAEEHAKLIKKTEQAKDGTNVDSGYYQYTGDDGKLYRVDYSADENGFIPQGDHIPTAPPVPKEIQRLLEYLKAKEKL